MIWFVCSAAKDGDMFKWYHMHPANLATVFEQANMHIQRTPPSSSYDQEIEP